MDRLLKLDPSNTELLEQKQRLLADAIGDTESKLDTLKKASKQAEAALANGTLGQDKYDALQREIIATENKLKSFKEQANNVESSVKQAAAGMEQAFDGAGDAVGELGKKLDAGNLIEATDQLSAMGDAMREIGGAAIDAGTEWSNAVQDIKANLGLTASEAENLEGIAKEVFEAGIADSVETATQAVMVCKQNFEDLSDTDLATLSKQLVAISDRTGTDLQENVRGASQMMRAFGIDGQTAMDLIAAGYQNNLNRSGDFTDTLNEYSGLFSDAGYSADQMFAILSAGMENGAFNTDKVADAIKELQIRMGDGTFEANISTFSSGTQKLFNEWKTGGATFAQVASSIGQDLQKMTPTEQQAALTALSTQFEDLGIDASVALLTASQGFEDATGKAKEFSEASSAEKWQGSLNKIKDALATVGQNIIEAFQPILAIIAKVAELFSKLPAPIQTFITVFGGVIVVFTALAPVVTAASVAFGALNVSLLPIAGIIAGIVAAITIVITIIKNWGAIVEWLSGVWDAIKAKVSAVWNGIKNVISTVWNGIKNTITTVLNAIKSVVSSIWNGIKSIFTSAVNAIKNGVSKGFNAIKTGIKNTLSGLTGIIKNGFSGAINFIKGLPGEALKWGKDFIQGFISGITKKISGLIDKIKGIGSKIRSFLHFSRPDEGPLRDYETWMPDMMQGLSRTLVASEDILLKPINQLAGKMASAIQGVSGGTQSNMAVATAVPSGEAVIVQPTIYLGNKQLSSELTGQVVKKMGASTKGIERSKGRV